MQTKIKLLVVIFPIVIALVTACTTKEEKVSPSTPLLPTPTPDTISLPMEQRPEIERLSEAIRQSHAQINAIWQSIAQGETASCADEIISPPSIEAIPDELPYSTDLQRATSATQNAIQRWKAECLNPRSTIPQTVINEANLSLRNAQSALDDIQSGLSASP